MDRRNAPRDSRVNDQLNANPKARSYRRIHTLQVYPTTMQLKIKMITETIVDKLKARLCACGNELEEVDNDTYSPTVSALTHCLMLQLAVHDRMHIRIESI